jgi:hypothetical protein
MISTTFSPAAGGIISWISRHRLHELGRPAAEQPGRNPADGNSRAGCGGDGRGGGKFRSRLAARGGGRGLPQFDAFNRQRHYLDDFQPGPDAFEFTATASDPWMVFSETNGTVEKDKRLWVSVDWSKAPKGTAHRHGDACRVNRQFHRESRASSIPRR